MSKTAKGNKGKIPRITEEEYAEYISSLKTSDSLIKPTNDEEKSSSQPCQNNEKQ